MSAEMWERFERIEECYEFMLAYAARGFTGDEGHESGKQLREFLQRAVEALRGLSETCEASIQDQRTDSRHSWPCWTATLVIRSRRWG
jgi:hypothetical protein